MLTIGWPQQVCASGNSTSTPSRRSSVHHGLAGVGEQRVVDAGDHQRDLHRPASGAGEPRRVRRDAGRASARSRRRSASRSPSTRARRTRAWTSTLPSAVASTGPATTGRPQRSAIAWQSSVFWRSAADHVHGAGRRRPDSVARLLDRAGERRGQALEDAAHELRPAGRRGEVVLGAPGRDPGGMSPGGRNRGSCTSKTGTGPVRRRRLASRAGEVGRPARRAPSAAGSRRAATVPITLVRNRIRAVDAALVGEVGRPARVGQDRRVELDADEPPGPAGDVGARRRSVMRHARPRPRRCRASRRRSPASPGAPTLLGRRSGSTGPSVVAGVDAARGTARPGRPSRVAQVARPSPGCGRRAARWSRRWCAR